MPPLMPSSQGRFAAADGLLWGRGDVGLSPGSDRPPVQGTINLFVPLNDPHVVAGLDEGDLLGKYLGVVYPDPLGPAVHPGDTRVIRREYVGRLIVLGEQL